MDYFDQIHSALLRWRLKCRLTQCIDLQEDTDRKTDVWWTEREADQGCLTHDAISTQLSACCWTGSGAEQTYSVAPGYSTVTISTSQTRGMVE